MTTASEETRAAGDRGLGPTKMRRQGWMWTYSSGGVQEVGVELRKEVHVGRDEMNLTVWLAREIELRSRHTQERAHVWSESLLVSHCMLDCMLHVAS